MLRKKTYHIFDIIQYLCRSIPFYLSGIGICMLMEAFLPAVQVLAVSDFVNLVTAYLAETAVIQDVLWKLGIILICQLGVIILPVLSGMFVNTGRQKLNLTLRSELMDKRARLAYWHVENSDSWDLVTRVSENPSAQFMDIFFNTVNLGSQMLTIASLLAIILRYSPTAGIFIVAVSVPLFKIAVHTGKDNYDMYKEEKKFSADISIWEIF